MFEKTLESPLDCKDILRVHPKGDQSWIYIGRTDAEAETPILWPTHVKSWLIGKDWCWEGLGARGEGDDRGWDSWMASPTWWTWVWVNSWRWWWTGRPGVLWFMGSQTVRHDWATELNWTWIRTAKSFLPCDITYSHAPGMRVWTQTIHGVVYTCATQSWCFTYTNWFDHHKNQMMWHFEYHNHLEVGD